MDQYLTTGPERETYAEDVRHIAAALTEGHHVYVQHCARMSKLGIHLTRVKDMKLMGHSPLSIGEPGPEWLHVAVDEQGSYVFDLVSFLEPSWVARKLGMSPGDGEPVGEFLKRIAVELKVWDTTDG